MRKNLRSLLPARSGANERSNASATAKNLLKTALAVTEKALDGVHVPGLKGSLAAVLEIIKNVEVGFNSNYDANNSLLISCVAKHRKR